MQTWSAYFNNAQDFILEHVIGDRIGNKKQILRHFEKYIDIFFIINDPIKSEAWAFMKKDLNNLRRWKSIA